MPSIRRWIAIIVLILGLALSSCQGRQFGPPRTSTPKPTSTRVPTITPDPTRTASPIPPPTQTLDPFNSALNQARQLRSGANYDAALAAYHSMLQQYSAESFDLRGIFDGIYGIAMDQMAAAVKKGDSSSAGCASHQQAETAFELVLTNSSKFKNDLSLLYSNSAKNKIFLGNCYLLNQPTRTLQEVIEWMSTSLGVYPTQARKELIQEMVRLFREMMSKEMAANAQRVGITGKMIIEKIGKDSLEGQNVSDLIASELSIAEICAGKSPSLPMVGTSAVKKAISCGADEYVLDSSGLSTKNPAEMWYVLEHTWTLHPKLECSAIYTTTGKRFTYSYPGQMDNHYTLKNARNGAVVAKKSVYSIQPRCVNTSCKLNLDTYVATCTGGEGSNVTDLIGVEEWLKAIVR